MRLRFGQFVELANQLRGDKATRLFALGVMLKSSQAATIIMTILDHGKLTREQAITYATETSSLPSGSKGYHTAFEALLQDSFLCVSTAVTHLSSSDRLMQFEAEERAAMKGVPAAKQLREIQEKARIRLNEEDAEISRVGLVKLSSCLS
jgi:hypothetical protein